MSPRCPICRKAAASRPANPVFPFCSPRCKQIDLGRWLGESYRIPAEPAGPGRGGEAEGAPEEEP